MRAAIGIPAAATLLIVFLSISSGLRCKPSSGDFPTIGDMCHCSSGLANISNHGLRLFEGDGMSGRSGAFHIIEDLRRHCNASIVERLVHHFGGNRLKIPHEGGLTGQSLLVRKLGWNDAIALCQAAYMTGNASMEHEIPVGDKKGLGAFRADRREKIETLIREGKNSGEIALAVEASRRTVLRVRAELKAQERPDVILMLLRGRTVADIAQFTIISELEIVKIRAQLVAEGKLPSGVPSA